jgi:hypothetical protein
MEVATLILAGIGAIGAVATATARWVSVYRTKQSDQRTLDRERSALRRALYEKIVHNTLGLNKDYWRGVARDAGLELKTSSSLCPTMRSEERWIRDTDTTRKNVN